MNEIEIKQMIEQIGYQEFYRYYKEDNTLVKLQQKEIEEKDKEIERLNKELEEKKEIINKFIADENGGVSYKLQNENERLNKEKSILEKTLKLIWKKDIKIDYEELDKANKAIEKTLKEGKNNEENN